jgi:hypothetical protein
MTKKITFNRRVVAIREDGLVAKTVFSPELGPGVLYTDEVTYTDKKGRGWKHPMFAASVDCDNRGLLGSLFRVELTLKVRRPVRKPTTKRKIKNGS